MTTAQAFSTTADTLFVPAIVDAMQHLVVSAEPAVVFTSLAHLCVPLISDAATVIITADDQQAYRISWPRPSMTDDATASADVRLVTEHQLTADSVLTPIVSESVDGHADFSGVLVLNYHNTQPTPAQALIGQYLVERTVALIHRERLAANLATESARVLNLEIALASNRDIGVAMGILMGARKLTSEQAFELLRSVSQNTHRKLRDIALDVALTGTL